MIKRINIGMASCGIAAGAEEVRDYFKKHLTDNSIDIVEVGCIGHCYAEPIVEVVTDKGTILYENVKPEKDYFDNIMEGNDFSRFSFREQRKSREHIKVTQLAGKIDPVSLEEYCNNNGYQAFKKAKNMSPEEVIEEIKTSGLRGRGGGGFPTGLKWSFLAAKNQEEKILICNADEGDPGAFMDRAMLESVPHQVLEGMLIAAYATGSFAIYIYVRAEYPLAVKNIKTAIKQIEKANINKINNRTININVKEGAGAFVCGEETALIHSLEGKRGTPRFRPPYPTDSGFKNKPSMINNVETFANVPLIIDQGGQKFSGLGTENSKGTKVFALAGDLKYPGLVEVPMGITIGEIIYEIGGAEKGSIKAVQIGGPSGGCIPAKHFDTPVDYDSLASLGAIMGSGGLIAIDNSRCMVETSRYFLEFTTKESCGKCTFCRIGTKRMLEALERITSKEGSKADLDFLAEIAPQVNKGSLCGLGQTAPKPVLSSMRFFEKEFKAHAIENKCPVLSCNELVEIKINDDSCLECGLCIKNCPVDAISGEFKVDNNVCTRCNSCIEVCPADAVSRVETGGENFEQDNN